MWQAKLFFRKLVKRRQEGLRQESSGIVTEMRLAIHGTNNFSAMRGKEKIGAH